MQVSHLERATKSNIQAKNQQESATMVSRNRIQEPLSDVVRHSTLLIFVSRPAEVECIALYLQFFWDYIPSPEPYYKPGAILKSPQLTTIFT